MPAERPSAVGFGIYPAGQADFAGVAPCPAAPSLGRFKLLDGEADKPLMDAHGAKLLAARIRTGVSVGMRIELGTDLDDESGLQAGDRGIVHQVDGGGSILVLWDRGFESEIDPISTPFHRLAA